jgi:hypothetical protein
MSTEHQSEVSSILTKVNRWPVGDRIVLAQQLLEGIKSDLPGETWRPRSLQDLVGLLKTDDPPPNDEERRKIIEEARQDKFGR